MKKIILGFIAATAIAAIAPSVANADVSTNGTTNDAQGYCIANHIANFNGDHSGIGWIRSAQTGKTISAASGNKAPNTPCVDSQGSYAPISNNG